VYRKALKGCTEWRRPVGRHRWRWLDVVGTDGMGMLKCRNWRESVEARDASRRRIEEAKAQVEL
jgi:hypothetical protein